MSHPDDARPGAGGSGSGPEATVTVVAIDDEPDLRALLQARFARSARFEMVAEAPDAASGLEEVQRHTPDIVLLDLDLPDEDGRKLLPRLVARSPRSMVVVLSGLDPAEARDVTLAAGAFAFLEKLRVGHDLEDVLADLHGQFHAALQGEDIIAPAALMGPH